MKCFSVCIQILESLVRTVFLILKKSRFMDLVSPWICLRSGLEGDDTRLPKNFVYFVRRFSYHWHFFFSRKVFLPALPQEVARKNAETI